MSNMTQTQWWKNFSLGEELSIARTFIYNGLRRFYELHQLDYTDDLFDVLYHLSIGIERLMKIAIILLEHDDACDQDAFENSLMTHNHQALLARIQKHKDITFSKPENAFLHLLTNFYEHLRYDRFSLRFPLPLEKEKRELLDFLAKQLDADFKDRDSMFAHENTDQYKKFIRKIVTNISSGLYEIVERRAGELNLYTYELRHGSKAETVFLGKADIPAEDVLWKELLIFFMNTKETSGYLKFLREIEPLNFDPALASDYLDCFQENSARALVIDELEALYEDIPHRKTRLEMMRVIGAPNVYFREDDEDSENDLDSNSIDT
jgi:hypothetical protein